MVSSTPESSEGDDVKGRTIFGAPCDVSLPFTQSELRRDYLGCQDLPTSMWVERFMSDMQNQATVTETSDLWGG